MAVNALRQLCSFIPRRCEIGGLEGKKKKENPSTGSIAYSKQPPPNIHTHTHTPTMAALILGGRRGLGEVFKGSPADAGRENFLFGHLRPICFTLAVALSAGPAGATLKRTAGSIFCPEQWENGASKSPKRGINFPLINLSMSIHGA